MPLVTIFIRDFDRSIRFYTDVLGLTLAHRFGDHFAQLVAADGVTIGLHPATHASPAGVKGSITVGFEVTHPIGAAVRSMREHGVRFVGDVVDDTQVKLAFFEDPDGNQMYVTEVQPQWKGVGGSS